MDGEPAGAGNAADPASSANEKPPRGLGSWRVMLICVGIFAVVVGAAVAIRLLTATHYSAGQPISAPQPVSTRQPVSARQSVSAGQPISISHPVAKSLSVGAPVQSVAFSPDGKILAIGLDNGTVQLWDPATSKVIGSLGPGIPGTADSSIAFSHDGKVLADSIGGSVYLWDVPTRKEITSVDIGKVTSSDSNVTSLSLSPDGRTVAVAEGQSFVLWNAATGTVVVVPDTAANFVAFSQNGDTLATVGGGDESARLWNIPSRDFINSPTTAIDRLIDDTVGMAYSPDDQTIAIFGDNGLQSLYTPAIWLWNTVSGKVVTIVDGRPQDAVLAGAFSSNGMLFAAGDANGDVRLWDIATDKMIATLLPASSGNIRSVAFSPSSETLAVGQNQDDIVRLWRL